MVTKIPGLQRLVVSKTTEVEGVDNGNWYMTAELHFASDEAMRDALDSEESKATDRDFEVFAPQGTLVLALGDTSEARAGIVHGETPRARGEAVLNALWGEVFTPSPGTEDFMNLTIDHLFGEVWSRPGLALRDRSLITVAALTVLGRAPQLDEHLEAAQRLGITRDELKEVMLHLAHYGGWPVAVSGLTQAVALFNRQDAI